MKILRKGDTCPCCGQTIQTDDPDVLLALSWIAEGIALYDARQTMREASEVDTDA